MASVTFRGLCLEANKEQQQAKIVRSRRYNRVMLEIGGTGDDHLTPLQGH